MTKPHCGTLQGWKERHYAVPSDEHLGYYITCFFQNHPYLNGYGHTSMVVKRDGNEIETLNSRYTLGKPELTT